MHRRRRWSRQRALQRQSDSSTSLPEGWDTNIGEDGHRLSGGQRQRIAIARAVLKDAPVLVLDEATSNVDNETEAALQRSIERISRDRTTLSSLTGSPLSGTPTP